MKRCNDYYYLPSSRVVVVSQPASVSWRQDVWVSLESPPHTSISSMVWKDLLAGRSGSVQFLPVEGTNTSTDLPTLLDGTPPDMIRPKHNISINTSNLNQLEEETT